MRSSLLVLSLAPAATAIELTGLQYAASVSGQIAVTSIKAAEGAQDVTCTPIGEPIDCPQGAPCRTSFGMGTGSGSDALAAFAMGALFPAAGSLVSIDASQKKISPLTKELPYYMYGVESVCRDWNCSICLLYTSPSPRDS